MSWLKKKPNKKNRTIRVRQNFPLDRTRTDFDDTKPTNAVEIVLSIYYIIYLYCMKSKSDLNFLVQTDGFFTTGTTFFTQGIRPLNIGSQVNLFTFGSPRKSNIFLFVYNNNIYFKIWSCHWKDTSWLKITKQKNRTYRVRETFHSTSTTWNWPPLSIIYYLEII